jgi:dihydropteroate synthase
MLRVHDVKEIRDASLVADAIYRHDFTSGLIDQD